MREQSGDDPQRPTGEHARSTADRQLADRLREAVTRAAQKVRRPRVLIFDGDAGDGKLMQVVSFEAVERKSSPETRGDTPPQEYNPAHAQIYAMMYLMLRDLKSRGKRT